MSEVTFIKFQVYPIDLERLATIKAATETRTDSQAIRDAIRCYEQVIGQKLAQTVP